MSFTDARTWAGSVDPAVFRISELERVLFQRHPDVIAAIHDDDPTTDAERRGAWSSGWIWAPIGIVILFAPVLGVAIYSEHSYLDIPPTPASVSLPVSALCFAITFIIQAILASVWLRQGAMWSPWAFGYAVLSALLAGGASIGLPGVAAAQDHPSGLWHVPAVAALALGAIWALALVLRMRTRGRVSRHASGWRRVRQTINALSATERRALRQERRAAVDVLQQRGILDQDHAQIAAGSELGRLHRLEPIWKRLEEPTRT